MINHTAAIIGTAIVGVALVAGLIQLTLGGIGLVEHRIEVSRAKRGVSARPHRRRLAEPHHWNKIILGTSLLVIGSVLVFLIGFQAPVSGTEGSGSAVPGTPGMSTEPAEIEPGPAHPDEFAEPGLEQADLAEAAEAVDTTAG